MVLQKAGACGVLKEKRIYIITGHYGAGKTNFALNLARRLSKQNKEPVALIDLDIVNPYFRASDYQQLLQKWGIDLIAPVFAGSNSDLPSLTGQIDAAILSGGQLVIDVGGDDAGATALGRYSSIIERAGDYSFLYIVNAYRYLTRTHEEIIMLLREIEAAARMKVTGIVDNSNLAEATTAQDIAEAADIARKAAHDLGMPLEAVAVEEGLCESMKTYIDEKLLFPVTRYVKKPWEAAEI